MLLARTLAAVSAVGFDPYAGFYHGRKHGRPALALDLMEPLRPAVDRIVFGWARRGELRDAYAHAEGAVCYLSAAGWDFVLGRLARSFEQRVEYLGSTWRIAVVPVEQARSLARTVMTGSLFEPFALPRD